MTEANAKQIVKFLVACAGRVSEADLTCALMHGIHDSIGFDFGEDTMANRNRGIAYIRFVRGGKVLVFFQATERTAEEGLDVAEFYLRIAKIAAIAQVLIDLSNAGADLTPPPGLQFELWFDMLVRSTPQNAELVLRGMFPVPAAAS